MTFNPLLSVVLPAFNAESYLAEAIESVLAQSFRDFEFIIIDDGSTDSSPAIISKFFSLDCRIRVLSGSNIGYALSLTKGIATASGKFIARMDADDVCLPERFESQIRYLENNEECVAIGSAILVIDSEGSPVCARKYPLVHEEIDAAHIGGLGANLAHPAVMFRRNSFDKVGGYRIEYEPAEDLDLWTRLAEVGKLANLDAILLKYRVHPQSATATRSRQMQQHTRQITLEACLRRGVNPPLTRDFVGPPVNHSQDAELSYARNLAILAWEHDYYHTARKHATRQLILKPERMASWKYFVRCWLGPLSKPLVRFALRLRSESVGKTYSTGRQG